MGKQTTHVSWFPTTRRSVSNAVAATVTSAEPFSEPTFRELQAQLKARGLPADGTKAQLIARLSDG